MQKIINDPKCFVEDMLCGYEKCHIQTIKRTDNPKVFVRRDLDKAAGRVGVVSGGGAGHMPAFIGYVRPGMLGAVAVGKIFVAPDANAFLDAFKAADMGKGVVCLYGNYKLDNENVSKAMKLAEAEGIEVHRVVSKDDVDIDLSQRAGRGLAGEVFLWKIGGAAASLRYSLDEIRKICQYAADNMYSLGIGLSACVIPEVGVPNFDVVDGTMEVGIGHHGEPGTETYKLRSANEIADLILERIFKEYHYCAGDEVAVMISGLGGTTEMEMYILYNRLYDIFMEHGLKVYSSYVGNYFTSLDMGGVNVTVMKLNEELKRLLEYKEPYRDDLL